MNKCFRCDHELIEDLSVFAYGAYKVEISKGKKVSSTNRVPVIALVCPKCLEVTFSIDKKGLEILQE